MKKRNVFSAPDMSGATGCIRAAKAAGVEDADIALMVRSDMSEMVPGIRRIAENDFNPGAVRGFLGGGAVGLVLGIVTMLIPALGVTFAGALAMVVGGGLLGGWSMALVGSGFDGPIRKKFEHEIEQGQVLVVIDMPDEQAGPVTESVERAGGKPLPFERPTMTS